MPFFDHYPYTNLHNVNLDWVLQAVKSWGAMVEQNNQNFIDLEAANESFKEYVTGYITNLDVQEEINNKLDQMLASGALTQYFAPYIQTDVSDWLEENITPTSPPVDASLTIAGAAADAKAVGDRLEGLRILPEAAKRLIVKLFADSYYVNNDEQNYIQPLLDALNNNPTAEIPMFITLNGREGRTVTWANTPYFMRGNQWIYEYPFTLTAIESIWSRAGTIDVGYTVGGARQFTLIERLTVPTTGKVKISLTNPYTFTSNQFIAINGTAAESALFSYNSDQTLGTIVGFIGGNGAVSNVNIGINFYGRMS